MSFKTAMKWLTTPAKQSWTLGELVLLGATRGTDNASYRDSYSRAFRITERAVTVGGAVALGILGFMSGGALPVIASLVVAKAAGMASGFLVGKAADVVGEKVNPSAIDAYDLRGYTKLGRAVQKKDAAAVKHLLDAGADVERSVPSGYGSETVAESAVHSSPEIKKLFADAASAKAAKAEAIAAPAAPASVTPTVSAPGATVPAVQAAAPTTT